jgi:hypothetical protein
MLAEDPLRRAVIDLVSPEVVREIRSENQALLEAAQNIQAGLETGRFDEAARNAAKLGEVMRKHTLLVEGVLDLLCRDDVSTSRKLP